MSAIRFHLSPPKSLPTRGAWIEIFGLVPNALQIGSLPTRGAWIEMGSMAKYSFPQTVAPYAGSVD